MKKIVIPFEGGHFPQKSLEFVRKLNDIAPVRLTAVFAPEVDYSQLWAAAGGLAGAFYIPDLPDEDEIVKENSHRLEEFCGDHSIKLAIHKDRLDFALALIRKETRFADVLLLDSEHFFENIDTRQPNAYMKEVLHTTECPILLLPDQCSLPDGIVLGYDGSPASVYAIKQFGRLFPEFSGLPVTLVYVSEAMDGEFPDKDNIEELASGYFTDLHLLCLNMDYKDFFSQWLPAHEKTWLVTGSFGRSELSQLFSKSFIARMIRDHQIPVFMAHR